MDVWYLLLHTRKTIQGEKLFFAEFKVRNNTVSKALIASLHVWWQNGIKGGFSFLNVLDSTVLFLIVGKNCKCSNANIKYISSWYYVNYYVYYVYLLSWSMLKWALKNNNGSNKTICKYNLIEGLIFS